MSSTVLSLIQEAIDVPLMDVKNIADMIYKYIEYDEYQGPLYDVNLHMIGRDDDVYTVYPKKSGWSIFIIDGEIVPTFRLEKEKRKAEEGGLTINGENYKRVEMGLFERWFEYIVNKALNEDRRKVVGVYFEWFYQIPNQRYYNKYTLKFLCKDSLKQDFHIKKKNLSKQETDDLLYGSFLQPLVDFYSQEIDKL